MTRRIFKTFKQLIISVLLLIYVLIALVNMGPVQSFFAARVAEYFSKEWKTEVKIGSLGINVLHHVSIRDILVRDHSGDTLLSANRIYVSLGGVPSAHKIDLAKVELDNPVFKLVRSDEGLNLDIILDYFKSDSPKQKEKSSSPFVLNVDRLTLSKAAVTIRKIDTSSVHSFGVNFSDMVMMNTNVDMRKISIIGDSITAQIEHLSTCEQSGFQLSEFSAAVSVSGHGIVAKNMSIKTPKTALFADVSLNASWNDYKNFLDSVEISADFKDSSFVNLADAAFWGHVLEGMNDEIRFSGKFVGTISDIDIEKFNLQMKKNTAIELQGHITGLPDIKNTLFNIQINDLLTGTEDIKSIALPKIMKPIPLPSLVDSINFLSLHADFSGYLSDFFAKATVLTPMGELSAAVSLATDSVHRLPCYDATLFLTQIDLSKLFKIQDLSPFDADVFVQGKGFALKDMKIDSTLLSLSHLAYKGNLYDHIKVYATLSEEVAEARVFIADDALQLTMKANADFSDTIISTSFQGEIQHADFKLLNLFSFPDSTAKLTTKMSGELKNFDLNNMNARLSLQQFSLKTAANQYPIPSFECVLHSENGNHHIETHSSVLDCFVDGHFRFQEIGDMVSMFMSDYLPPFAAAFKKKDSVNFDTVIHQENQPAWAIDDKTQLKFSVNLKDLSMLHDFYTPFLHIAPYTVLEGKYTPESSWKLTVASKSIGIGDQLRFSDIHLRGWLADEKYHVNMAAKRLVLSDSLSLQNLQTHISTTKNALTTSITFDDGKQIASTNGRLNINTHFSPSGIHANLSTSHVSYQGLSWDFAEGNQIHYDGDRLEVQKLLLYQDEQEIGLNGAISSHKKDKMTVTFHQVDLSQFNPLLASSGFQLQGKLSDQLEIMQIIGKPVFTANLIIDSLSVNNILFDQAKIAVAGDESLDALNASIRLYKKGNKGIGTPLDITGVYYPKRQNNNLDFLVHLKTFDLRIISGLLSSFTSRLEGRVSTDSLTIKGSLLAPIINGALITERGKIKIDFLNTTYDFNGPIYIEKSNLRLDRFTLKDDNASETAISGRITHNGFKDIKLDLHASMKDFILLNTPPTSSSLYYGRVVATASADLKGTMENLSISVDAVTNQGTFLTVPVNSKMSAKRNSFITIGNSETLHSITIDTLVIAPKKTLSMNLSVKITVTPEAKFFIPLDFNQIKGNVAISGDGTLKIGIDKRGNLVLTGSIGVADGTFRMNMMDVVTKEFSLAPGGHITFAGSPTDAQVDITALYKTRTTLTNILGSEYDRMVDAQSVINLRGKLNAMTPKFDLRFPSVDDDTREKIFMEIDRNDEKEMIQQMASLLLLRQLYSNKGGYENQSITGGIGANTMDVAFNQLSGLVSQLVPFVDNVDLNYNQGNTANRDQIGVAMSKSFGRFSISGNVGFDVGGNNNSSANTSGDVQSNIDASYRITPRLQFKAFNHSNANNFSKIHAPYTQGIGLVYTIGFDSFKELFSYPRKKKKPQTISPSKDTIGISSPY